MNVSPSIDHLVQQAARHAQRTDKPDYRPEWLKMLIIELSDLFELQAGVARACCECSFDLERWELRLFLVAPAVVNRTAEPVLPPLAYSVDLRELTRYFDVLDTLRWNVPDQDLESRAEVIAEGTIEGEPLRIVVCEQTAAV